MDYQQAQEYEADLRGAELCLRALQNRGVPPQVGVIGPDAYFSGQLLQEQVGLLSDNPDADVLDVARLSPSGSDTHPPIRERRDRVRETALRSMPADLRASAAATYTTMDTMHAALLIQAAGVIDWSRARVQDDRAACGDASTGPPASSTGDPGAPA